MLNVKSLSAGLGSGFMFCFLNQDMPHCLLQESKCTWRSHGESECDEPCDVVRYQWKSSFLTGRDQMDGAWEAAGAGEALACGNPA